MCIFQAQGGWEAPVLTITLEFLNTNAHIFPKDAKTITDPGP